MGDWEDDGEVPAELTAVQRTQCIIAAVLGAMGTGYALLMIAILALNGALLSGAGGGPTISGLGGPVYEGWAMASWGIGAVLTVGALCTSVLAFAAGIMGVLGGRLSALRWTAAVIVAYDVVAYLVWPVINYIISMVVIVQTMPEIAVMAGLASLVSVLVGMAVSALLIGFWSWVFMSNRPT